MSGESAWERAYELDRNRGILTPDDRKYLVGKKEYSNSQSIRRRRAKIRERVENAFLDFIILEYIQERDLEQIFGKKEDSEMTKLGSAFSRSFIFLYETLVRVQPDYEHVDMNLEVYLRQAIEIVDQNQGYHSELEMEIQRETLDSPSEIFERAKTESLDSLTGAELDLLWKSGEVDPAAFAEYLNEIFPEEENLRPADIAKYREFL